MAYKILDNCIICGKCEIYCPVGAISLGEDIFEINKRRCVECKGYFDEPQCVAVCPVDVIIKIHKATIKKN